MLAGRTDAVTGAKRLQLRLTLDTTRRSRTLILPPVALAVLLGLLPVAGLLYLAATCYFIFHDDLLAKLTQRQIAMQYGYEDRIAAMRHEITNLTQHAKINEAALAERLGALTARQGELENRTVLVASLVERARALHSPNAASPAAAAEPLPASPVPGASANPLLSGAFAPTPPTPAGASAYAPSDRLGAEPKPEPQGFELRLDKPAKSSGAASPSDTHPISPLSFDFDVPLMGRLDSLTARQKRLDQSQLAILGEVQQPAQRLTTHLRAAFNAAGLAADQLRLPRSNASDTGGPFVPLPADGIDGAAFVRAATEAQAAIAAAEKLQLLATRVPFGSPLTGETEVTSPFGARIDPFLGRPALHTGIDLRQDYGAPVRVTASGVVSFAGGDGGYGNMVEVDHGNGLSTRYAHLSSISVRQGQKIEIGTVVGHIGETGRATGPHLHYETRIDGVPVDPARFLRAGARLRLTIADNGL
ncbi:MAG: M23 family metallopeptidase [Methylovirgula sp.]